MDDAALAELIRDAQQGRAAALERLVEAFAPRVAGFLYRMTGSRQASEDLAQEVFLRLVRMLPAYRHEGRFEPWLFRIAANLARDRVRRLRRSPVVPESGLPGLNGHATFSNSDAAPAGRGLDGHASPAPSVDARMVLGETVEQLNAALAALPEGEREVIMLRHFSDLSFKEIAELTGTPLGTALARAHRGLARLREAMARPAGRAVDAGGGRDAARVASDSAGGAPAAARDASAANRGHRA